MILLRIRTPYLQISLLINSIKFVYTVSIFLKKSRKRWMQKYVQILWYIKGLSTLRYSSFPFRFLLTTPISVTFKRIPLKDIWSSAACLSKFYLSYTTFRKRFVLGSSSNYFGSTLKLSKLILIKFSRIKYVLLIIRMKYPKSRLFKLMFNNSLL